MNAFISYSIADNQQYILNLLAQRLAEKGLTLVTSTNQSDYADFQVSNEIRNCALFIGLITKAGRPSKTSRVYSEFQTAHRYSKPAIYLIEDNVDVAPWINNYQNTLRFNRFSINQTIQQVKDRIYNPQTSESNSNAAAWVLGGVAVIGLLSWLSDKEK